MARFLVRGYRRVPAPPPRMTPSTLCCVGGLRQISSRMEVGARFPSTALVVCERFPPSRRQRWERRLAVRASEARDAR